MDDQNQNEEGELGRGQRKKSRNPRYFNSNAVNILMSDDYQRSGSTNGQQESQNKIDDDVSEQTTEKELVQIHKMDTLQPLDPRILTEEEKKSVIASLIVLTGNRDGTIKARQCTDGRKQRYYMIIEESASPTVSTEAIFITSVIDA